MNQLTCVVCEASACFSSVESALVPSNVRAFRHERFVLWRCPGCASLHARDEVDLARYYAGYPFHALKEDIRLDIVYANLARRLRRAGVNRQSRILDYGCGSGKLVRYLRKRGYAQSFGFDEYSAAFSERGVLSERYDCVIAQDVLEHVAAPLELLAEFDALTRSGGIVVIGTPDAAKIDLGQPQSFVHTLHAPYHRHILALDALLRAASARGWQLTRCYPTMYTNTFVPCLNEAFYRYYAGLLDDTLDAILGEVRLGPLLSNGLKTLWVGLFGALWSRGTDPMSIFRRA